MPIVADRADLSAWSKDLRQSAKCFSFRLCRVPTGKNFPHYRAIRN